MKQIGTVVDLKDNIATVECDRQSACDMCENAESCKEKCKKVYASAANDVGAEVGDTVEIETPTAGVLTKALIVFILPIIIAMLCYFAVNTLWGEGVAVIFTLIALVLSVVLLCFLLNKGAKGKIVSRITRIL